MKAKQKYRLAFLGDLQDHASREVCWGAGEYAARCPNLIFDPMPLPEMQPYFRFQSHLPPLRDLKAVDGLLLTEQGAEAIRRNYGLLPCPHVFYLSNMRHGGGISVGVNEEAIAEMAAGHLIQRGYPHLAYVGNRGKPWSELRARAFVRYGRRAGLAVRLFEFDENELPAHMSGGIRACHHTLDKMLDALPKPCGVATPSDVIAFFVLEAARWKGLRIPQNIGVIGVDNDPFPSAACGLAISTVVVPFRQVGYEAARLLHRRLRGDRAPSRLVLGPVRVETRLSTNAFIVDDPVVRRAQIWIENHRQRSILVPEVVRAVNVSRITLIEKFRRFLRLGVHEYILQRRLEYACDLLRAGELNVDQTALACGFSSTIYFCKVFSRMLGTSPGKVRLRLKT